MLNLLETYKYDSRMSIRLIPGGIYKVVKPIIYCGINFNLNYKNNITLTLGEMLLFTDRALTTTSPDVVNFTEKNTVYYFIYKTKLIYIRSGWITAEYLEQIDL
jgi:hypothetical protein